MRSFDVLAWTESGGFVLYVPEIEALTRAGALDEIEPAATDLIAELLGLDPATITVRVRFRRPRP
ncbi:hypothetical protein [Pseudonocardia acaciae]|uniref:hypothetical protein n=1 Tax=Pseudonocardia acaciae TaxID=551276 RepID=UPI000687D976|nr:hypothetical protein [Pseudonocardia acaciae]